MPITEQQYPIRGAYFAKLWIVFFILLLIAAGFVLYSMQPAADRVVCGAHGCRNVALGSRFLAGFGVLIAIVVLVNIIGMKVNFRYAFDDTTIALKQGLFRREEKYMPYVAIQNIFVSRGLLDRIFGIASLKIQNAAALAAGATAYTSRWSSGASRNEKQVARATAEKNSIVIPGLSTRDAEALRDMVLQKIGQNPTAGTGAGL